MKHPFSQQPREMVLCPYCAQLHPEDLKSCPVSGQVILLDGKYRLKSVIGEGSFGVVWAARNIDTQKEVAIKSLRVEVASDPAVLARFFWEATAAGRIHNPHVCDVLDLVKSGAHGPYIVLEKLSGRSFEALIQEQGRLAPEVAVGLLRQALVGLEAVHRAGIVHRDMKPENIFLHEGGDGKVVVKLLDFGISKFSVRTGSNARTAADMFMGTPEYTSPEQARGAAEVDSRTDIWAIGAILYKALAGVPPFSGPDIPSLLTAILHTPHPPLSQAAPHVPGGLAAAVDRCLSKDRGQRFASCAELSAALEPFEALSMARTVIDGRSGPQPIVAAPEPRDSGRFGAGAWPGKAESVEFSLLSDERIQVGERVEAPAGASLRGRIGEPSPSAGGQEHVILSASAADRRWLDHLRQHLKQHRTASQLTTWECGEFEPGTVRREALGAAFARARAAILLVSAHYLAEEFVPGGELYSLVLMAQERGLPVMWLVVGECDYASTDVTDFKPLGDPGRPLDRLPFTEADRALEEICDQIAATLGLTSGAGRPGRPAPPSAKPEGSQQIEQRLEEARARKAQLEALGADTREVRDEINMLRRSLRMGRPLQRGDVLDDRFVVLDQLGAGGFATVWRALDQTTDAPVALKVLHGQHAHNAERRERFFRGARIMAQLDHPNIVKIIEPWASDGEYEYFAMQFVSGGTLRDAVLAGRLSQGKRVQMLLAVADALAFAHERGIVHRDVKPSNILVADDGTPYLTDFDLVRAEDTTGGTAGGLGTIIYAAPEMMERASEADARADVYGLGMTLAFLFYERDLTMEVIRNTDRLIGELNVPEAIRMVIRTAITWNREHRFRTAAEFRSALSATLARRDSLPPTSLAALQEAHSGTMLAPVGPAPVLAPTVVAPQAAAAEAATLPSGQVNPEPVKPAGASQVSKQGPPPGDRSEVEQNLSLVKAFAAIAKDAEVRVDHAVSEVFASLEVHDDAHEGSGKSRPVPLPEHDRTLPDTLGRPSPGTIAGVAFGAAALLTLLYLLLT